jgi:hypothetical protein
MANLGNRRNAVVSANKTLTDSDAGLVQIVTSDAKTITLPAAAAGKRVTVRIGGAVTAGPIGAGSNKTVGVTVTRATTDTVTGLGVASGTTVTLAKSASNVGDEVTLQAVGTAWHVVHAEGAWVVA